MKKKPSYEELERRVRELEKETADLKKLEAALRQSEEKYRIPIENSLAGIYIIQKGRFKYVNPRFLEITGYSRAEEILGRPFWELVHPDDRALVKRRGLAREKAEVHPTRYAFRLLKKDGSTIRVDIGGGHATYMGKPANVGNLLDVTELERVEEALRESEERYRMIVESIEDGYYEVDLDGNLKFFNKSLCEIVGYDEDDLMGKNYAEFTDKDYAAQAYRTFNEVYKTGKPVPATRWEIIRKDGAKRCIELSVSPIRGPQGLKTGFRGIGRDITRRRQIEDELRSHRQHLERTVEERTEMLERANEQLLLEIVERKRIEERLLKEKDFTDAVINSLPGVFYLFDLEGRLIRWNRPFEEITGYLPQELSAMKELDFIAAENKKLVAQKVEQILINGKAFADANLLTKDGKGIPYFFSGVRVKLAGKTYLVGLGLDITERKRTEEALAKSEQQLRLLSAQLLTAQERERKRVAQELHDGIGQILSGFKFKLENTLKQMYDGMIVSPIESLESIIPLVQHSIKEVKRISMDLRPSILDDLGILPTIMWFCRELQAIYSHMHIEKEIEVAEEQVPERLKTVLFRVLQEALNNVVKHSKADSVRLCLQKTDGRIELVIQDNGAGFDLNPSGSAQNYRKGLGLASMKERTELSGGSFSIEPVRGKGTVVRASWPESET